MTTKSVSEQLLDSRSEFEKELSYFSQEIKFLESIVNKFPHQIAEAELVRMNNEYIQKITQIKNRIRVTQVRFVTTNKKDTQIIKSYYNEKLTGILTCITNISIRFDKIVETRKMRFLKIVYPDITEEQVRQIQIDQLGDLYKLQMTGQHKVATDALAYIESRHVEILNLERSVRELHELFRDMSILVEHQSEHLDTIEANITQAAIDVEKGAVQIQDAHVYQKKSRKSMMCLCVCLLLILVALIIIPITVTSLKK